MYTLGIKRDFIARHFLIGGDWGAENLPNSHHYFQPHDKKRSAILVSALNIANDEQVKRWGKGVFPN